jgi:hypothetical protein
MALPDALAISVISPSGVLTWSSYFPMVYEDSGFERLTISYLDGSNTAGAGNS